jgi:cysteine desulfurase
MLDRPNVYLDYNATTPCDDLVVEAMLPFFRTRFGNSASRHWCGSDAESAVTAARQQVAALIGAAPGEMIWTSGATEANNLAIRGVVQAAHRAGNGKHIVTQATEHNAVLDPIAKLRKDGFEVTILPVDAEGRVSPDHLATAIRKDTALVSIMWANNETGTVQDMAALVSAAKASKKDVVFHSDATQALGKLPELTVSIGIDLLSFTAHKLYGPKGCGALYLRRRRPSIAIEAIIDGGGHERGLRSGTLNVPGIVGFGKACEIAKAVCVSEQSRIVCLRDKLWGSLTEKIPGVRLNGSPTSRLPNTINAVFDGTNAESILMACGDIAMSSGSACTSASIEASHVLRAMGIAETDCFSSIRISLGRFTTIQDIEYTSARLASAVASIRALNQV